MAVLVELQVQALFHTLLTENSLMRKASACLISVALIGIGCGPSEKEYIPLPPVEQQFAPEPVYHTTFISRPPRPVPHLKDELHPDIEFKAEVSVTAHNEYLEKVVKDIASQTGYRPYVSGLIAKRRVSIDAAGSLDAVSKQLADSAKASVSVDHLAREVRFMAGERKK